MCCVNMYIIDADIRAIFMGTATLIINTVMAHVKGREWHDGTPYMGSHGSDNRCFDIWLLGGDGFHVNLQ